MLKKDLKVNFSKKIITVTGGIGLHSEKEIYSLLMDLFDEPEHMKYDIPMIVTKNGKFKFVNGWKVEKENSK